MNNETKRDIIFCVIISLVEIIYLYLHNFLLKNIQYEIISNIVSYLWFILHLILLVYYFYNSKNKFITKNLIFIITNFTFILIGYEILFLHVFKLLNEDKIGKFFSFWNLKSIISDIIFIIIYSLAISCIVIIFKKIKLKFRKTNT